MSSMVFLRVFIEALCSWAQLYASPKPDSKGICPMVRLQEALLLKPVRLCVLVASTGCCGWYLSPDSGTFVPGHEWSAAADSSGHSQRACICIFLPTVQVSPGRAKLCPSRSAIWTSPSHVASASFSCVRDHLKLSDIHFVHDSVGWHLGEPEANASSTPDWTCVSIGAGAGHLHSSASGHRSSDGCGMDHMDPGDADRESLRIKSQNSRRGCQMTSMFSAP